MRSQRYHVTRHEIEGSGGFPMVPVHARRFLERAVQQCALGPWVFVRRDLPSGDTILHLTTGLNWAEVVERVRDAMTRSATTAKIVRFETEPRNPEMGEEHWEDRGEGSTFEFMSWNAFTDWVQGGI